MTIKADALLQPGNHLQAFIHANRLSFFITQLLHHNKSKPVLTVVWPSPNFILSHLMLSPEATQLNH